MSDAPAGLVLVDKPGGVTSHDVVSRLRRLARTRKVGHAGTLDPMATGVLVVGVGAATRLLGHLALDDKAYSATVRLGRSTVTDDAEGAVVSECSAAAITETELRAAVDDLTGDISQVPSTVSAIKVDGRRSYERVRSGDAVALAARPVTVTRFDVGHLDRPTPDLLDIDVEVEVSSGTYVRALARDLGTALGVGGHLTRLRRTRVGPFALERARSLDELAAVEPADVITLPLAAAVRASMPVRDIDATEARELSFGRALAGAGFEGVHGAVTDDGAAVALLQEQDGRARPVLVFAAAG